MSDEIREDGALVDTKPKKAKASKRNWSHELGAITAERDRAQQSCERMGAHIVNLIAQVTSLHKALQWVKQVEPKKLSGGLREITITAQEWEALKKVMGN